MIYYSYTMVFVCTQTGQCVWLVENDTTKILLTSETRFDEILPKLKNFKSLWQTFEGLFLIWQNVEPT